MLSFVVELRILWQDCHKYAIESSVMMESLKLIQIVVLCMILIFCFKLNHKGTHYFMISWISLKSDDNFFLFIVGQATAAVTISPSEIAQVCVGDNLDFTCNITGTPLEWHFPLISSGRRTFHSISASDSSEAHQRHVLDNSTVNITISRISAEGSPVSSRLLISPVTESHNGTEVTCVDVISSPIMESSTTIIIFNEPCQMNYTTIFTMAKYCKYSYVHNIMCSSNSLWLEYVESDYAAVCNNPYEVSTDENLTIVSYNKPAVKGSTVTFRCSHGMEIQNATCSDTGKWEPQLSCIS